MATHLNHHKKEVFYFVTFTCYKWLPLIEQAALYDYIPGWVSQLSERGIKVSGYVIMPNHIHLLVYVEKNCKGLNRVLGEAKRFMAYEIVARLKRLQANDILKVISNGVQEEERKKGKKHQVFRLSFDAKEVEGNNEIGRILEYMHHNPVQGKWNLTEDFVHYSYSSAKFYEFGEQNEIEVWDFRGKASESSVSDSEGV